MSEGSEEEEAADEGKQRKSDEMRNREGKIDGHKHGVLVAIFGVEARHWVGAAVVEVGSICKVVIDLCEQDVIPHEVMGVVGTVVLDKVEVRVVTRGRVRVADHTDAILALNIARNVLVRGSRQ